MKCWECGREPARYSYEYDLLADFENLSELKQEREMMKWRSEENRFDVNPTARHFCRECYKKICADLSADRKEYGRLKKKLMLERAVRMLEKQAVDIYEYKDIIKEMSEYVQENPEKFESSYEMIAAIILVDNAINVKMQCKVDRYRVDFLIPEFKVALEIDGFLHDTEAAAQKDTLRDQKIKQALGPGWEVVRIGTKHLEKNARALPTAIEELKKLRQNNNKRYESRAGAR